MMPLRFLLALAALWLTAQTNTDPATRLWQYRNLGKAFYENPTTQNECVAEFKKALDLEPSSLREKLNYGLALVRAANNPDGLKLLEEVQRLEPKLPHTWFNLGIHWKKQGDAERAIPQFTQMVKLAPSEPKGWYNLGASLKLGGQNEEALKAFERASQLDPTLAAARFQLYNAYRAAGRLPDAQAQLKEFQRLKEDENRRLSLAWNLNRTLAKLNYRIHTDAVKAHLIPALVTPAQAAITYATEADLLNVALFSQTARQWRDANPKLEGNVRNYASVEQLLVLANMEGMNAEFIHMGLPQGERLKRLNQIAIRQMQVLTASNLKALPGMKEK